MMRRQKQVENKRCKAQRKKTRIWSRREGDCVVYCLTNRINGRMYIGYTSKNIFERWGEGGKNYKGHCPAIWSAIEKYSWSNFEKRILVDHLDEETAKAIEAFTISFLKERGYTLYNLTNGGDSSPAKNPEVRRKISENHADFSGENNPFYGKHHSKDLIRKRSKPVAAIDPKTGEQVYWFPSTMEAERAGFHRVHISECCNNKQNTHRGLIWRFAKLEPDQTE